MAQNISSAVMQQRHEARDSLDDFGTPPWATRALVRHVLEPRSLGTGVRGKVISEPCCNRGHMAMPLFGEGADVVACDVHDYGYSRMQARSDFLVDGLPDGVDRVDGFVFNPPFVLAEQFIAKALSYDPFFVATFVRTSFLEGVGRYDGIFKSNPPSVTAQFSERVILSRGAPRDPAVKYFDEATGKWKKPSTATSYLWMVWLKGWRGEAMSWIPPCRKHLELPGDYAEVH